MKEDQASEFILSLRQETDTSVPLGIDPALLLAAKRGKGRLSAGFLAACIATMMLPLKHCAVVAGNGAVMRVRLAHDFIIGQVPDAPALFGFQVWRGFVAIVDVPKLRPPLSAANQDRAIRTVA